MDAIPHYLSPVSIIPGGCPQFLDFALPLEALGKHVRYFYEELKGEGSGGRYTHFLHCLENRDNVFTDQLTGKEYTGDTYSMQAAKELKTWDGQWLPVPFLRTLEQCWPDGGKCFECGPSNWARARVMPSSKDPNMLRVVIIFDTTVEERPAGEDRYHALSPQDVSAHGHFMLAHHVRDNSWFLNEAWVDQWLLELYTARNQGKRRGAAWGEEDPYVLKHLASYLTWLDIVRLAVKDVAVQVINPARDTPVDVDLILDIGNSRTTGILVETPPQCSTDLNQSYVLRLRDLSQPDLEYADPFETRVEFVDATFGNDTLSRRSGRQTPAFAWPSAVRIGPEAARLATQAVCAEGTTGMSSPKRYLWDERPWQQTWRYNTSGNTEPMVNRGLFARQLNPQGTPLSCFDDPLFRRSPSLKKQQPEPVFESLFTRSSLMMFMLGEILTQTLITINSPATRARGRLPNLPRRLRRLIFTVPTAMPVAEKRIFRRWVLWAVKVIWEGLGWSEWCVPPQQQNRIRSGDYRTSPLVRCDWDEASCSQLVLLYNELTVKQHGDAHHLFRLMGKKRARYSDHPCVRIASIDIGGGTTDLSITTYELASGEGDTARIVPHTEFRDGFNIAGDEVAREVVLQHVIPAVSDALQARGVQEPRLLLAQLFGRDTIGMSQEQRNTRIRLVRQVALPVALGLLRVCEQDSDVHLDQTCTLGDFFEPAVGDAPANGRTGEEEAPAENGTFRPAILALRPQQSTLDAVTALVRDTVPGLDDFSIMDVPITVSPQKLQATIQRTLAPTLSALCELAHLYDTDMLLLTGRPSAWKVVASTVMAKLPVPPDRIIPMRRYHVGSWYPFPDTLGRIQDPKTTVVVGAILCALAEGHIEGFSFDSNALRLTSTARYIGELDINTQLRAPKVWFKVDVDAKSGVELNRTVAFNGQLGIGYRQLGAERWPATRYHLLTFASEDARARASGRLPYKVDVTLNVAEMLDDEDMPVSNGEREERSEGEFSITAITDNAGNFVSPRDLEIRLQTLPTDEGYWLDTGVVNAAN